MTGFVWGLTVGVALATAALIGSWRRARRELEERIDEYSQALAPPQDTAVVPIVEHHENEEQLQRAALLVEAARQVAANVVQQGRCQVCKFVVTDGTAGHAMDCPIAQPLDAWMALQGQLFNWRRFTQNREMFEAQRVDWHQVYFDQDPRPYG